MSLGFPGFASLNRQAIRTEVNPMDKSTVVSILPKEIKEIKPTLQPREYVLAPGSYEKPSILVVGTASWFKDVGEDQPFLEIPAFSTLVAESIVRDKCSASLASNMGDTMPGLFWLPGEHTVAEIKSKFKTQLDKANMAQKRWYSTLVKLADTLWARTNGNPMAIADDMKLAARELGLNKEWLRDFQHVEMVRCVACGQMKNPEYPVCTHCKAVVDVKKATELGLKFAV